MTSLFGRALRASALALPALLLAAGPAAAGALSTEEILRQFNVVVLGSMTSQSSVEGRAFVGGSLNGGEFNSRTTAPASDHDELLVGGALSGNVKVQNGGDATIGGSGSGVLDMNAGPSGNRTATFGGAYAGVFNQGSKLEHQTVALPDFATTLTEAAAMLSQLEGTAPTVAGNRGVFALSPDSNGLSVYDIADGAGFFGSIGEIQFAFDPGSTVVINVGGSSMTLADNFLGGPFALASSVLWNFYEATELTFASQFFGTVLAPGAAVTTYSAIEGTLVAGSLTQRAQVHLQPFAGDLPAGSPDGPATEVPLPGTLPLLLSGIALLGLGLGRAGRSEA